MRRSWYSTILRFAFWIIPVYACVTDPDVPEFPLEEDVQGYRPVYASAGQDEITFGSPREVVHPGKIFIISNLLLVNEMYEGIHVFNNSNPENPVPIGFLSIAGNTEAAVKGNILYVDHLSDLVALNVTDWNNIIEVNRLRQTQWRKDLPPANGRYFECVDPSKGTVVGWELVILSNPKCFH